MIPKASHAILAPLLLTLCSACDPSNYTLRVQKGGAGSGTVSGGGIDCGATCTAEVRSGTPVTLAAAAGAGSGFAGWTGCDSTAGASCTVTLSGNRTVIASFDAASGATWTLTVVKAGGGTGAVPRAKRSPTCRQCSCCVRKYAAAAVM